MYFQKTIQFKNPLVERFVNTAFTQSIHSHHIDVQASVWVRVSMFHWVTASEDSSNVKSCFSPRSVASCSGSYSMFNCSCGPMTQRYMYYYVLARIPPSIESPSALCYVCTLSLIHWVAISKEGPYILAQILIATREYIFQRFVLHLGICFLCCSSVSHYIWRVLLLSQLVLS